MELVHDIEELLGKKLEEYEVEEDKVLKTITKVRFLDNFCTFPLLRVCIRNFQMSNTHM